MASLTRFPTPLPADLERHPLFRDLVQRLANADFRLQLGAVPTPVLYDPPPNTPPGERARIAQLRPRYERLAKQFLVQAKLAREEEGDREP